MHIEIIQESYKHSDTWAHPRNILIGTGCGLGSDLKLDCTINPSAELFKNTAVESRNMVQMNLFAGKEQECRHREGKCEHGAERE